jgi:predicted metal-dependent RNase
MVKFQSRNLGDDILGSEKMKITPLGAGSEVGRSCIVVEFKGKTIMVHDYLVIVLGGGINLNLSV